MSIYIADVFPGVLTIAVSAPVLMTDVLVIYDICVFMLNGYRHVYKTVIFFYLELYYERMIYPFYTFPQLIETEIPAASVRQRLLCHL